ncbi:MAG: hypothetical protein WAS07_14755 [Micropruina sp.]
MSSPGDNEPTDLLVRARSALIDAVVALDEQRDAVIVIGAQAVYLRTGKLDVALAETTKDSDIALDPRALVDDPRVETAMRAAGFFPSAEGQPGSWVNPAGIPVDLMVPAALAGPGRPSLRGARLPPHDRRAMRRARGLEAVLIDNEEMEIQSLTQRTVAVCARGSLVRRPSWLRKSTRYPSELAPPTDWMTRTRTTSIGSSEPSKQPTCATRSQSSCAMTPAAR